MHKPVTKTINDNILYGVARSVTGSKHLVALDNGKKILFDCDLFQGMGPRTDDLNQDFGFEPADIDYHSYLISRY